MFTIEVEQEWRFLTETVYILKVLVYTPKENVKLW